MTKYPISRTLILVLWIIGWSLLIFSLYNQFKKQSITERQAYLKILLYSACFLCLIGMLVYRYIDIFICSSDKYIVGLLWTILNSVIMYVYLNICGIFKVKSDKKTEIVILIGLLSFSLLGFGYFGIRFTINPNFIFYRYLYYHSYQSNSYRGIKFIGYNLIYLLIIFFMTTLTEREIE